MPHDAPNPNPAAGEQAGQEAAIGRAAAFAACVRYYAAETRRAGYCYAKYLHEIGFDKELVLGRWDDIRKAGEAVVAAWRAAESSR